MCRSVPQLRKPVAIVNRDDTGRTVPRILTDTCLLEQAVEKLVRFGQQVGATPEEMISFLDSGITIRDLLTFLAPKTSGAA
jgi:hypothetical protein